MKKLLLFLSVFATTLAYANVAVDPISAGAAKNSSLVETHSAPGTPQTIATTVQGNASGVPVPVSGTVTATNPSVGSTAATPPSSATLSGGVATTAAPTYTTGQMDPLSLTLGGLLRVDGSGVTQPISGSLTNISGTISLPTGAATAAKQPALGTAGTPSSDVISVQGVSGGTALPISAAALPLPSGASTSALQTTGNTALTTINTTLGTPMQQTGGSVTALVPTASSATLTNVANAATNTSGLASNAARKAFFVFNDSVTYCYYTFGATASTTSFVFKVGPGALKTPEPGINYTGAISFICDLASGTSRFTEL